MTAEIVPFEFNGAEVRTVIVDNEPWFIAADVCRVLEHTNPSMAVASLDDDEKGLRNLDTPFGPQSMVTVSESGLYALILRSRKPEAKAFKRHVTHTILPSIRKTGSYVAAESPEQFFARALTAASEIMASKDARIAELEPAAAAWDDLAAAEGDYAVGEAAKILARGGIRTGPTRLFDQLALMHWIFRNRLGVWEPYSTVVDMGYMSSKLQSHEHPRTGERIIDPPQVRVTVKGLERLRVRLAENALTAVSA
jgi:anti-repressor protein